MKNVKPADMADSAYQNAGEEFLKYLLHVIIGKGLCRIADFTADETLPCFIRMWQMTLYNANNISVNKNVVTRGSLFAAQLLPL